MSRLASVKKNDLQPEMATGTSPILHFPIAPGCFHPTASKRQEYAALVRERVNTMLQHEERSNERRDHLLSPFDVREWKPVQTSKAFSFYKRVRGERTFEQLASEEALPDMRQAVMNGSSMMLCHGQVQGSMENIMYGMTASSQEDVMTVLASKHAPKDCVWLGTGEGPTRSDPFHSMDFIWAMPKVTAYTVDTCYLKATGVELDRAGKPYGYLVLHSVRLPQCRPFDARGVTRVHMYFCCLFRASTPDTLLVTVRGLFDVGHHVRPFAPKLISLSIKSIVSGLLNAVAIGVAKKLTLMARRKPPARPSFEQTECFLCARVRKPVFYRFKPHLGPCGVCGASVCGECIANPRQLLFLGRNALYSKRPCCLLCMRKARVTSGVRPRDFDFQGIADFVRHRSLSNSSSKSSDARTLQSPLANLYPYATIPRSCTSPRRCVPATWWSTDLKSPAEASLDTELLSRDLDEADFGSSEDESDESIVVQPASSLIASNASDESTLTLWHGTPRMDPDDFIPMPAKAVPRPEVELLQTLFRLNVKAAHTFMQTQATARGLWHAELD